MNEAADQRRVVREVGIPRDVVWGSCQVLMVGLGECPALGVDLLLGHDDSHHQASLEVGALAELVLVIMECVVKVGDGTVWKESLGSGNLQTDIHSYENNTDIRTDTLSHKHTNMHT